MAAQFAGRGGASKGGRGGGGGRGDKPGGRGSSGGGGWVNSSGSKSQWISLLKLLAAGGRAASVGSGLGLVDFGFGDNAVYLQRRAALAQLNEAVKYDRLPEEMRRAMTKKEYERSVVTHKSDAEHDDSAEGGNGKDDAGLDKGDSLLPVVVFSFSKKKCEEIADMWAGQDLLCAREKNEVRALMHQVAKRLSPQDARLPQVTNWLTSYPSIHQINRPTKSPHLCYLPLSSPGGPHAGNAHEGYRRAPRRTAAHPEGS